MAKHMKQSDFPAFVGAKTVPSFECHFDLVVQPFDHSARNGLLGPEVIEQNLPMVLETGGCLLERRQARAPDSPAPTVQELAGPGRSGSVNGIVICKRVPSSRVEARRWAGPWLPVVPALSSAVNASSITGYPIGTSNSPARMRRHGQKFQKAIKS